MLKAPNVIPAGQLLQCRKCKQIFQAAPTKVNGAAGASPAPAQQAGKAIRVTEEHLLPLKAANKAPSSSARDEAPLSLDECEDLPDNRGKPRQRTTSEAVRSFLLKPTNAIIIGASGLVLTALIALILTVLISGRKGSHSSSDGGSATLSPEEIYRRQVLSAVFILTDRQSQGSGCLIDKDQRLVATAYHVVKGAKKLRVIMPKLKDGKAIGDFNAYGADDIISASVIASDSSKDLAILRLESVPSHVRELPLASSSPDPGEEVHLVGGSPRGSVGLWVYSKGNVREVQEDRQKLTGGQQLKAWVIRTSNPSNPGDSGAALVNGRCELVGICSAARTDADLVRIFIDVRELRELLRADSQRGRSR